jgi:hypothetical protein
MNPISGMRLAAGRLAAWFRELDEAQRRVMALQTAPDAYLADPGRAPDTYAEFRMRTSGVLVREPSARARERRARVTAPRERRARGMQPR